MRRPVLALKLVAAAGLLAACATTPSTGPMGFFMTDISAYTRGFNALT